MVIYDKSKGQWFGIGIPTESEITMLSSYTYQGQEYLLVAGEFSFTVGNVYLNSLAFYNLQDNTWTPISAFSSSDYVLSVFMSSPETMFVTGSLVSKLCY